MKNNYGKIGYTISLLLTTFCSILFFGCGDENITLTTLFVAPEEYDGRKIIVVGRVKESSKLGESFLVLLEDVSR